MNTEPLLHYYCTVESEMKPTGLFINLAGEPLMAKKDSGHFFDAGRAESKIYEPDAEVKQQFAEAQSLATTEDQLDGEALLSSKFLPHHNHEVNHLNDGEEAIGGF